MHIVYIPITYLYRIYYFPSVIKFHKWLHTIILCARVPLLNINQSYTKEEKINVRFEKNLNNKI